MPPSEGAATLTPVVNAVARRAGWGFADQILSSASNFALSAFVAATVDPASFGAFTLVYAVYGICVGLSGGLASIPLVVRYSAAGRDRYQAAARGALGTALLTGVVAGAACLTAVAFIGSPTDAPLAALAVTLPGLLVQDSWRYSFVAGGHSARATANDGLWVSLQVLGSAVLLAAGHVTATAMILIWGGSATVAALAGCLQARLLPAPHRAAAWLREQGAFGVRYAIESLIHRSGGWFVIALVGLLAGLRVVAALRGALLLLGGPLNLLFAGTTFVFVSEGVRLLHRSPALLPPAMRRLSVVATAVTVAWSAIVLALPDAVGHRVLGATWPAAERLLPAFVVLVLALAVGLGAVQGMLALGAARRSLFTQWAGLALDVPSVTSAAALAGARGAALAYGLSGTVRTGLAWAQFRRALREPAASLSEQPDQGTAAQTVVVS